MLFSWKNLAGFVDYFYICMCVFHSIRFKVNKVMGHGGDPFFILSPSNSLFIPFKLTFYPLQTHFYPPSCSLI